MDIEAVAQELAEAKDWSVAQVEGFCIFCEDIQGITDLENTDWDEVADEFDRAWVGNYDCLEDFCTSYEVSLDDELPTWAVGAIDWEIVWDSELRHEYTEENGHYFHNTW